MMNGRRLRALAGWRGHIYAPDEMLVGQGMSR